MQRASEPHVLHQKWAMSCAASKWFYNAAKQESSPGCRSAPRSDTEGTPDLCSKHTDTYASKYIDIHGIIVKDNNPSTMSRLYTEAVENHDPAAQYFVGYCYEQGKHGVVVNYKQAAFWYVFLLPVFVFYEVFPILSLARSNHQR